MSAPTSRRRHDIDALRAIAFGLLILYHVGMFYVPWGWHVKSEHIAPWLQAPMMVLNQWRMPLVFLISGLAVNFLLGEGDRRRMGYGAFAWLRVKRLLVPLIFGMLLIVPPQAYLEALANGATEPGYWPSCGTTSPSRGGRRAPSQAPIPASPGTTCGTCRTCCSTRSCWRGC